MKKKILWVSEASFMNTGFSVQAMECLKRLHSRDKYELAELGCYAQDDDPRKNQLPWKFYGGIPTDKESIAYKRFQSNNNGQFGAAVYEDVLLDFKPDIVIHARDGWMEDFEIQSPFRNKYKSIWIPTIDGEPQKIQWLDWYRTPDILMTHCRYAKELLSREAPDVKVFDMANPGVDHELYKPLDKDKCKEMFGLPKNSNIVLTVMRNQKRKLYPDLLETFSQFLDLCVKNGNKALAEKTFLWIHTSYPDVGYDISRLIMQNKLCNKVYVTYYCRNCNIFYPDFFQSEISLCKRCGELSCFLPNTQYGVTRKDLCYIYNAADAYIQYAICEGLGMPLVEAKACGVPVLAPDYSAMSEHCECDGSYKIKIQRNFHETVTETEQSRSLPDNKDASEKLYKLLSLPIDVRRSFSSTLRQDAIDHFSFDRSAKIIEKAIDSLDLLDRKSTWDDENPSFLTQSLQIPDCLSNGEFIDFLIINVLKDTRKLSSEWRNELVKGLNVGYMSINNSREGLDREGAVELFQGLARQHNFWEKQRCMRFQSKQDREDKVLWELV